MQYKVVSEDDLQMLYRFGDSGNPCERPLCRVRVKGVIDERVVIFRLMYINMIIIVSEVRWEVNLIYVSVGK